MRLNFKFKHVDRSEALIEFVEERMEKVKKFELKPTDVSVTVSAQRHMSTVEVHLRGPHLKITGVATSVDFYEAADTAIMKVQKQMAKFKGRIQHHKSYGRSRRGQVESLTPELETIFDEATTGGRYRKTS